ncbi:MAG: M23 family metallopeptidase [Actinobacteria bacterium]|nr:MAG: M23 family metallopeptidase [Actinomycetota bacterium]
MHTVTALISRRCRPFVASAVLVSALAIALVSYTPAASGREGVSAHFTQTRSLGSHAGVRPSYGWPIKPFHRQHPVRAYLNDPREGDGHNGVFHFGIDISAPDHSAVYAVAAGKVYMTSGHHAVAVVGATRTFGYWHVVPAVRNNEYVRIHQLLGHVAHHAGHVHFAERRGGDYLNPLRPGGIGPYTDRTPPTIASVEFLRGGREVGSNALTGRVDIVVEAFDTTPLVVPLPWSHMPVTAARIQWGISLGGRPVIRRRTAVDFRWRMLPARLYYAIYARGTKQNHAGNPGHYRFYLARGFDTSRLPTGLCRLGIEAVDTRGNLAVAQLDIARSI